MRHIVFALSLAMTLLIASLAAGAQVGSAKDSTAKASADSRIIRLAVVRTEVESGILNELLDVFQKQTGYSVQVYVGQDVYEQAKAGKADLVLSHFRHKGLGEFVSDGFGLWPVPVMANVTALVFPPGDPAGIRTLNDPMQIFRRIAETKSPFVVNGDPNTRYVIETLWNGAGQPDKKGWYIDSGVSRDDALKLAAEKKRVLNLGRYGIREVAANQPLPVKYGDSKGLINAAHHVMRRKQP